MGHRIKAEPPFPKAKRTRRKAGSKKPVDYDRRCKILSWLRSPHPRTPRNHKTAAARFKVSPSFVSRLLRESKRPADDQHPILEKTMKVSTKLGSREELEGGILALLGGPNAEVSLSRDRKGVTLTGSWTLTALAKWLAMVQA